MTDGYNWRLLLDGLTIAVISQPRFDLHGDTLRIDQAVGQREMPDLLLNGRKDSKAFELAILDKIVARELRFLGAPSYGRSENVSNVESLVFLYKAENIEPGYISYVH